MLRTLKLTGAGVPTLAAALILSACESNPPLAPLEEELSVELAMATSDGDPEPIGHAHIHTLEETTFHVAVRDHRGHHVTDFGALEVEHRREGTDTWRTAAELHRQGETFTGSTEYATSGAYDVRIAGMRQGDGHMHTLHHEDDPVSVARAHAIVGDLRIEFESFPGHLHTGDEATVRFWVMEAEADDDGTRAPVSGISATILCEEADGSEGHYSALEAEAGVYETTHTFEAAGRARATIQFTTSGGTEIQATFEPSVAAGH